jgi:pre-mRNA-splicing factor ISY1
MRFAPKTYDEDGREVSGSRGYKYFGRARELPGVKELFEDLKPKPKADAKDDERRQRAEMRRNVDADYYGFNRDEDDGVLLAYEKRKEAESFKNVVIGEDGKPDGWMAIPDGWEVPGLEEVTEFLVERRKSRLLERLG